MCRPTAPALGIDIGATTMRVARVDQRHGVLDKRTAPTPHGEGAAEELGTWLTATLNELARGDAVALGVAVAALVDARVPSVTRAVNLSYLEGPWLPHRLANATHLSVSLHTDIDAATWAEYLASGGGNERVAHLRIGSGVGLGIVGDGELLPVEPGRTTHASIIVVDERNDAPRCRCGLRGCLEQYVGGEAVRLAAGSIGLARDTESLQRAIDDGFAPAAALVEALAVPILSAMERVRDAWAVDHFVLGGGVVESLPALAGAVERRTVSRGRSGLSGIAGLVRAGLGDDAGVIGAAALARTRRDPSRRD